MARSYATIKCSIWEDADFLKLSAGGQRTYFMLTSQPDLTACGTLALTLRRWSKTCSDSDLDLWLKELLDAGFVLIDEDTEELLVRTFVKYDDGYKHALRLKALVSHWSATRSPLLKDSIATELALLQSHSNAAQEALESIRSVVTLVSTGSTPHSTLLKGGTAASNTAPLDERRCAKHQNIKTPGNCGGCKDARIAADAAQTAAAASEAESRTTALAERLACRDCDSSGFITNEYGKPIKRCDHRSGRQQ